MAKLIYVGKVVVTLAACWAVAASCYIFLSPVSGQGVRARRTFGESGSVVETFTTEATWYESQGLWGVFVLVVFAGLYLLAVYLAWRRSYVALTILSLFAIVLSIIAGFSIGGAYLPAAVGLLTGALMFLSARLLESR